MKGRLVIEGGHPLCTLRKPHSGALKDHREVLQAPHYTVLEHDLAKQCKRDHWRS